MGWAKLSETLPHQDPDRCNRCGATGCAFEYWRECDDDDRATTVVVVLCSDCARVIIEPHPRLYQSVDPLWPMPGAMMVCADCPARIGRACTSALAKFNGGPGLEYEPKGQAVHVCRSPRRTSGWTYIADGPVTRCSGKEAAKDSQEKIPAP